VTVTRTRIIIIRADNRFILNGIVFRTTLQQGYSLEEKLGLLISAHWVTSHLRKLHALLLVHFTAAYKTVMGWEGMEWVNLAYNTENWQANLNVIMNHHVPEGLLAS